MSKSRHLQTLRFFLFKRIFKENQCATGPILHSHTEGGLPFGIAVSLSLPNTHPYLLPGAMEAAPKQ